jgi:hypothetical protein
MARSLLPILRLPRIPNHCFRGCPLSIVIPSVETSACRRPDAVKYSYLMAGCHQTCENMYGTYSDIRKEIRSMSFEVIRRSHSCRELGRYQSRHLPKHFVLNAGNGTMLKRTYEIEAQNSSIGRRLCFVKFCHALPAVDQQGLFYPY